MSSSQSPLDAWLTEPYTQLIGAEQEFWDPGFDGESRVVLAKLGPYRKLFEYPPRFVRRFYHQVYPLPIEDWHVDVLTVLYGGLCTMEANLTVHFQAAFNYVERNRDALPDINAHIKAGYEGLIKTAVDAEIRNLRDGSWIQDGLADVEKQIENVVNETMILKQIKCRAICTLKPVFADISDDAKLDGRFTQESVYLNILKKSFEFHEKQNQELLRQQEQQEMERLKQLSQANEIQQKRLALESENIKQLLAEQGKQNVEQYAIEARLHTEKVKHEKHLQSIEQTAELQYQMEQQIRQQQLERQLHAKRLEHDAILMEKELQANIKVEEATQMERQKLEEILEAERIEHQTRLKEMQMQAEIKELELRVEVTKNKDAYLHRQIEWLVLDKQRAELTRAIKEAEQPVDESKR